MAVWFVTGASRGFGKEIVNAALAEGHQVVAAVRDPSSVPAADGLLTVRLDVTAPGEAEAAAKAALEAFGRVDVLVNNAGYGLFGAVEEISDAEARALFDTNVFGLLAVTRALLPTFRAQRSGHVVNIGSVAGISANAGMGLYSASKFALEGITEALAAELAPFGARATVVEPGSFRTDFLNDSSFRKAERTVPGYEETVGAVGGALDGRRGRQPGDPAKAVAAILRLVASDDPPVHLPLGEDCVARLEKKLDTVAKELADWRDVAVSTGY